MKLNWYLVDSSGLGRAGLFLASLREKKRIKRCSLHFKEKIISQVHIYS